MLPVDAYLKNVPRPQREQLLRIRKIIKQNVPDAKEVISYGMPGFTYGGKYLVGYAAFKDHMSLFPTSAPIEALKNKLKDFKLSKGTVQFTQDKEISEQLIKKLLAVRLSDIKN